MPSLSSGATAEYHRSRQSHDSSVRSLSRPTLSDPHRHQASDHRPLLARHTLRRGGTSDRKGRSAEAAPSALAVTTSEEVGTPRTDSGDPIRTRRLEADRSSERHGRSRGLLTAEPPAVRRWQAITGHWKGARGGELVVSNTQARQISFDAFAASLRPDLPKKASRRIPVPVGFDSERGSDTPTLRLPITGRSSPIVSPQRTAGIQGPIGRSQATERPPRWPRFRVSSPRGAPLTARGREARQKPESNEPAATTSCGRADKHNQPRATHDPARRQTIEVSQQETKTPSRGSLPSGGIRCTDRCALDCLPSAIRSQGFSPSQRFDPDAPSWLCFKPHPPLGFMGLQSFSHRSQP